MKVLHIGEGSKLVTISMMGEDEEVEQVSATLKERHGAVEYKEGGYEDTAYRTG